MSISDQTRERIAKLAAALNMSADEGLEHYLNRFVLEPLNSEINHNIAEEAEQIVCASRAKAEALAKSLAAFCERNHEKDPRESLMHVSVVQYRDGWGVKAKPVPLTPDEEREADRLSKKEHRALRKRLARQTAAL